MTVETCCRTDESSEPKPKPWVLSKKAKRAIHNFSRRVLKVAEEIRAERGYPDDPKTHFYPNCLKKYGYFTREAGSDYVNERQEAGLIHFDGNLRYQAIGAIGFHTFTHGDKTLIRASIKDQKALVMSFLEKLGFRPQEQTRWQKQEDRSDNEYYDYSTIQHPTRPITAEFGEQKSNGDFAHVWFRYHELYEHQLPLEI